MTDTRVKFQPIWDNHPDIKDHDHNPCKNAAGDPAFGNECSIRLSIAFKRAGINVPATKATPHCWFPGHVQHVLQAEALAGWILLQKAKFGKVDKKVGQEWDAKNGVSVDYYKGKKGIIFFKDFWRRELAGGKMESLENQTGDHIEAWDGQNQAAGSHDDYFVRSKQLWFWELP